MYHVTTRALDQRGVEPRLAVSVRSEGYRQYHYTTTPAKVRRRQEARKVGSCLLGKDVAALSLTRRKDLKVERSLNSQDLSNNLEMKGVVFSNLGRGKSLRFRATQKDGENNLTLDLEALLDTDGSVG